MSNNNSTAPVKRQFARKTKRRQKDFLTLLRASGGFIIIMGLLFTFTGIICFIPFHNLFSKLVLVIGLMMALFGFAVKLLDICLKMVGEYSR